MFKSARRIASGPALGRVLPKARPARRFVSTAPPHQKSRSWKSSATRWGLAGAFIYYYNTSTAFAEEPAYAVHAPPETTREQETYPTVDAISEQRKAQTRSQTHSSAVAAASDAEATATGSPEALEEEASQQGAFNEETGEINWDCPCLGGMAYGPCGEQFRAAFSCFVFSKEEPKGVDCIEQFKMMQGCFREHPDVYGSELDDEEEPTSGDATPERDDSPAAVKARKPGDEGPVKSAEGPTGRGSQADQRRTTQEISSRPSPQIREEQPPPASSQVEVKHHVAAEEAEDKMVPKAWHDSRETKTDK